MKQFFSILIFFIAYTAQFAQQKPNFVFVLTDDQSYGYLGCENNTIIKTPNIDALAKEGTHFNNAHITSAICTPSRVSILLSQYERKHGVNFNSGTSISDQAWKESYPVVMRKNGYYTGWIGKNHTPVGKGGYESGLIEKSFDYWYAGHRHLTFYPKSRHSIFNDAQSDTQTEIIREATSDFLDTNENRLKNAVTFLEKRPVDQPFMLSINFNLPHGAGTSTMQQRVTDDEIYKSLYRDVSIPLPENYIAKKDIKTPKLPSDLLKAVDRQKGYNYVDQPKTLRERQIRQYQAMTGIDRMIGELRENLEKQGLDKNTIIVFTSDHGLFMGEFGLGGKGTCYEVNTHVPLIIYNPLRKRKVKESTALVQSIDIAPTMLSMANIKAPDSYQGKDLSKLLKGEQKEIRDYLFTENLWSNHFGNPRCEAVQNKEWKYIRYYKNENFSATKKIAVAKQFNIPLKDMLYTVHDPQIAIYRNFSDAPLHGEQPVYEELYNLKNDPKETNNVATKNPKELELYRGIWKKEILKARGDINQHPKVYRYTNGIK